MKGNLKCQESIMLALQNGLHNDLGTAHRIPPRETLYDYKCIEKRTQAEGLEFLTKTLPQLAKSLDDALKSGTYQCPSSFKRYKGTNLPRIMHGFFNKVFRKDGTIRREPCIAAIRDIRQVGYLFYKYQLPYPDHLITDTIQEFINDDNSIVNLDSSVSTQSTLYYAKGVIHEITKDFNFTAARPKNGPGSVANGQKPWQRYQPTRFYSKLDDLVPYDRMYFVSDRHLFDCWDNWYGLECGSEATAKLIAVPKDSRGPRLISSEQSEYMAYQQCMRHELVAHIETNYLAGGHVNFADQTVNGRLALQASSDGSLATLDLSKASDLLSLDLVDALFEDTGIHQYLMNSRSTHTQTPLGSQCLRKFAPMGSALCFPIQALTFYALIVGRLQAIGVRLGDAARSVYVYGDDIIVPIEHVHEAIDVLESVGLKINKSKSCFTGKFRESCGVDAFNGEDITPIKIKKLWNTKPDAQTIVSWVDVCNSLFANGLWKTSDVIRRRIDKVYGKLPIRTVDSPILGYTTWSSDHVSEANWPRLRWNVDLQCFELKAKIAVNSEKSLLNHGWQRLLRFNWERSFSSSQPIEPFYDPMSTDAFTVRNAVKIVHSVVTESSF